MVLARSIHLGLVGDRCCGASVAGRVFGDDLLQRDGQYLPRKHLDVLLDVSWLRVGKAHDNFEELLGFGFRL